jgi:tagatose-6-phosphate ketose/aldose isomerase
MSLNMNEPSALQVLLESPRKEQEERGFFHTAREIASQPDVWLSTAERVLADIPRLASFCAGTERLLLTGAGSSYYAALSAVPLLRSAFRVVEAIPSTEILMDPESCFPRESFTLVSLARSGNSPEGNAVFSLAGSLRPGKVKHVVITCSSRGELAGLADSAGACAFKILLPDESNDQGLAMTASFSSLTLAAYSLGFLAAQREYRAVVQGLSQAASELLADGSDLAQSLATQGFDRVFFLGSRPYLGGVLEAHLKVQELSGGLVVAKAEDTLGFRHGFMAAVDSESLVVLSLSREARRRLYEVDLLTEIRRKGLGKKIAVIAGSDERSSELENLSDAFFRYGGFPSVTDTVLAPLVAVPGQLLGLFLALKAGLMPDNPSPAGIISRVVQGVQIHW